MKNYSDFTQFDDMVDVNDDTVIDVWIEPLPITEDWIIEHARLSLSFVGTEKVRSRYAQFGDTAIDTWYHFRDTRANIIGDMVCCGDMCGYCFSAYVLNTNKQENYLFGKYWECHFPVNKKYTNQNKMK